MLPVSGVIKLIPQTDLKNSLIEKNNHRKGSMKKMDFIRHNPPLHPPQRGPRCGPLKITSLILKMTCLREFRVSQVSLAKVQFV